MRVLRNAASLSCTLAMLLASIAHGQSDEAAATARRLMIHSGLAVQLRGLAGQFDSEIKQNAAKLDDRMVVALSEAAREAFRPELLQEDMTARIAKKLTVGDMKAALAWLESDVGQRVTRAEELASTTLDEDRLRGYADRLKSKPLAPRRQKLLSELISATSVVRVTAATQEAIALGVAIGMDSLQPKERRVGEAELRARLREAMPPEKLRAAIAQQLPMIFAYMYRDVLDADLAGYVSFLKSAPGKRYQEGTSGALMEGLGRASVRVGELAAQRQHRAAM